MAFLSQQLGAVAGAVELIGLYGLERVAGGRRLPPDPDVARWQSVIAAAADRAEATAPAGVQVEPKGLAVTLHFRGTPEAETWAAEVAQAEATRSGLEAQPGKMWWSCSAGADRQGDGGGGAGRRLAAVCFAGDDNGDLPAFEALGRLGAAGVATLAVAVVGPETPAAVLAAADMAVDGPAGLLSLLQRLAGPGPL